uniref:Pentraxin (PTX) domain-containing protein n=1 Tax=Lates calcarifer TaxID=8187 RepID=A0A4W6FUT4_LATCA
MLTNYFCRIFSSVPSPGHPAMNLDGKMFTLSLNGGDISLFPPNYSPPQPRPSPTRHYYTTTPYPTQPPTRGLSVCLRFLTDFVQSRNPRIFTLSPSSSNPLTLGVSGSYWLSYDRYRYANIYLQPSIRFWSEVAPDIWTRVCITLDSSTNVVQLFSGSYMSIRKLLPVRYSWTGEPVITFSGFDGQVTDIQVWDYPLRYREVTDYMNPSAYKLYRGSVLTWSYISYSLRGNPLLEDVYEIQAATAGEQKGEKAWTKGREEDQEGFQYGGKQRQRETTALMNHAGVRDVACVRKTVSSVPCLMIKNVTDLKTN